MGENSGESFYTIKSLVYVSTTNIYFEYIGYMFRPVNRSSSGHQSYKSKVLLRYWDPNKNLKKENRSLHTNLCFHRQMFPMNLVSLMGNLNLSHPVLQLKMFCGISPSFKSQAASYFLFSFLFPRNEKWMLLGTAPSCEHYVTSSPHCGTIRLQYVYALYVID